MVISPAMRSPWTPNAPRSRVTMVWMLTLDDGSRMPDAAANRPSLPYCTRSFDVLDLSLMKLTRSISFCATALPV